MFNHTHAVTLYIQITEANIYYLDDHKWSEWGGS